MINVRGTVVPVLDFRARFGLPPRPLSSSDRFIVADAGRQTVALRADAVVDLLELDEAAISPPERLAPRLGLVAGVARLPDGLLLLHDLRAFLSQAESEHLDAALEAPSS